MYYKIATWAVHGKGRVSISAQSPKAYRLPDESPNTFKKLSVKIYKVHWEKFKMSVAALFKNKIEYICM